MTGIEVRTEEGRARCVLRPGLLSPRLLGSSPAGARVALVATRALLLAGDCVRIDVHVGAGATLEVVETSGTVAYDARGGDAGWDVTIRVDAGGTLVWAGLPFVVAAGARVARRTTVDLAPGAVLLLRETLVLGRSGELGGDLTVRTRCTLGSRPALAEDLRLDVTRTAPGVLADARVLDSVLCLGVRPPATAPAAGRTRLDLDVVGAMARSLAPDAHTGSLDDVWRAWEAHVRERSSPTAGTRPPALVPD